MKEKIKKTSDEFKERVNKGDIFFQIIDGLDGSGKGACVNALAEIYARCGVSCLKVELPAYDYAWGKIIKQVLGDSSYHLSLAEKIALFALNRMEALLPIKQQALALASEVGQKVVIIFDRFVTSSALTLAYDASQYQEKDNWPKFINQAFEDMLLIDRTFLEELNLSDFRVSIPVIAADQAIAAIDADETRSGRDLYETETVQNIAAQIYDYWAKTFPEKFCLISQYHNGERLPPTAIARQIIKRSNNSFLTQSGKQRGEIRRLEYRPDQVDYGKLQKLFEQLQKRPGINLSRLNPYNKLESGAG